MKLDTEAIDGELRKLEGGFVHSLRGGFSMLSDIQGRLDKNGDLIEEKNGAVKNDGEKALDDLNKNASSVKESVEKISDADRDYVDGFKEKYKDLGQKQQENEGQEAEDSGKATAPRKQTGHSTSKRKLF
ncbi:MAG: hypothetical protein IJS08_02640 [Victivallales bacterium]|nr:hypothetical protein [Victivallales bacterium]